MRTIGYVALLVNDYDEALGWYREKLGFHVAEDTALTPDKRWVLVAPHPSAETRLLLAKASSPSQKNRVGDQTGGRVFLFLHTDDFYRDFTAMKAKGVEFLEEPREESYGTVAVFRDPYGNRWDLLEPKRPRSVPEEIRMTHTDGRNADFRSLVRLLDEDLAGRYGEAQKEYDRYNGLEDIADAVVLYCGGVPAACGAFKPFDEAAVELKRVFVVPEYRRRGFARRVIGELEKAARLKGYTEAVLETGTEQLEAVRLYRDLGFSVIENFGPYAEMPLSVCMRKTFAPKAE